MDRNYLMSCNNWFSNCKNCLLKFKGFTLSLIIALGVTALSTWFLHHHLQQVIEAQYICHRPKGMSKTKMLNRSVRAITVDEFRLPTEYHPKNYTVELDPNFETGKFRGHVSIMLEIKEKCPLIILHCGDLHIVSAEFRDVDAGTVYEVARLNQDKFPYLIVEQVNSRYFFVTSRLELNIIYDGVLNKTFHGLYHTSYQDENNTLSHIVATNFKPTYARYVFPCIDEPSIRTPYTLRIKTPPKYKTLTNFRLKGFERLDDEGTAIFTFVNDTFFMSPYEIAIVVTNMKSKEYSISDYPKAFKIYGTFAALKYQKFNYTAKISEDLVKLYTNYFGISYPLPKLDLVVIPDIQYDASASWGLITFKESHIVYTRKTHTLQAKIRVAGLLARELSRAWINSLIKMNWWDNLWINEGFANFMQYRGLATIRESWKMMQQFLIEQLHPILALDATENAFRLQETVENSDDIAKSTNSNRYKKAASIMNMIENFVGIDYFRLAFTKFLMQYKDGKVDHKQFHADIKDPEKYKSAEIMETFMRQKGYPLINVEVKEHYYELTQEPFSEDRNKVFEQDIPALMEMEIKFGKHGPPKLAAPRQASRKNIYNMWTIPITYQYLSSDKVYTTIFKWSDAKITLPRNANNLIKLNIGQVGYYRVNYPTYYWYKLIEDFPKMEVSDRMHMLEETFALAKANRTEYEVPLNLTKKLVNETEYNTLRVVLVIFEELFTYLGSSSKEPAFKEYAKSLINETYHKYTWNVKKEDDLLTRMARFVTIRIACMVDHEHCLTDAADQLNTWLKTAPRPKPLSPELGDLIYIYGMRRANTYMWHKMCTLYMEESTPKTKLRYLRGLASVENAVQMADLFNNLDDPVTIRPELYFTLLGYISDNPYGTSVVWDYLRNNKEKIEQRFGVDNAELAKLLPELTRRFSTQTKYEELELYSETYSNPGSNIRQGLNQALQIVKSNVKWLSKYQKDVEAWIDHLEL